MNTSPSVYQIFVCADVFFCHLETVCQQRFTLTFFYIVCFWHKISRNYCPSDIILDIREKKLLDYLKCFISLY